MTEYKIPLDRADANAASHGVTHASVLVYRVRDAVDGSGPIRERVHNRHFPHRVRVWDNTGRPNANPDKWNKHSGKPGPGRWLDPSNRGTDNATTVTLSSESVCVDNTGTGTGTASSGQVYAPGEGLRIGDTVTLVFPPDAAGEPVREERYTVEARWLADPTLVPLASIPAVGKS